MFNFLIQLQITSMGSLSGNASSSTFRIAHFSVCISKNRLKIYFISTESYMQDNKTVSSIKIKKQSMTDIIDMYVTP